MVDQRANVFPETTPPGAVADIGAPGADALVGRDPPAQIFDIDIIDLFPDPCPHPVPERDVGEQHGIGDILNGFGGLRGGFDIFDAHVIDILGVDPAQDLEILLAVTAHDHPVRLAGLGDGGAFGEELRIGGNAEILHFVLLQDLLQVPGRADRHRALVYQHDSPPIFARSQQFGNLMHRIVVVGQIGRAIQVGRGGKAEKDHVAAFDDRGQVVGEKQILSHTFLDQL